MGGPPAALADYQSYPYLTRGVDYPAIELADPAHRRSRFAPELTATEAARVERLMTDSVVISLHDHPQLLPADMADAYAHLHSRYPHTAFRALRESGLNAVFDNWFGLLGTWRWEDLVAWVGTRAADIAHQDGAVLARGVDEIRSASREGRVAFVLGAEAATSIENDLNRLDVLYGMGVRQLGLVYAESNSLGSGQKETRDGGLTTFGRRAVARMNALGILVDVSHASDQTSLDAIEASTKPVAITHAGARAVWPIPRMKPDEVLTACAERGGVLGFEAAPHTTISYGHRAHSIESVMDHFTYAVDLIGIEHVAFGPDTFYGDHVEFHHATGGALGLSSMLDPGDEPFESVAHVDGLENPTENFRNITRWLVQHGYSDSEIAAVLGGNILRVLEEAWR